VIKDTGAHLIVCDLEQDQLSSAKRIKELQGHGGDHRAEETIQMVKDGKIDYSPPHRPSPHDLRGEEIRYFLQTEQYTTNRRTECDCNTSGGSGTQDLASFTWTLVIRSPLTGHAG